jgi:hypothetical protein
MNCSSGFFAWSRAQCTGVTPSVEWHSGQHTPSAGRTSPKNGLVTTHLRPLGHSPLLVQVVSDPAAIVSHRVLTAQKPSPSTVYRQKQQPSPLAFTRPPQANAGSRKPGETATHRHSPSAVGDTVKLPDGQVGGQTTDGDGGEGAMAEGDGDGDGDGRFFRRLCFLCLFATVS